MLIGAIVAALLVGGGIVFWVLKNKSAPEPQKPKVPLSLDEMTEQQLEEHLDGLEDDVISVDGVLTLATQELRTRAAAMNKAKEGIVTANTSQAGNEEALQSAVEAFTIAEDDYLAQLEKLNGDGKRDPGLKARVVEVHRNFAKAKRKIEERQHEFGAARVASINAKLTRTNAAIATQNTALQVTTDTTATKALEVRVAAEREAEIMRGGNPRADMYRARARGNAVLRDLGIRS